MKRWEKERSKKKRKKARGSSLEHKGSSGEIQRVSFRSCLIVPSANKRRSGLLIGRSRKMKVRAP